MQTNPFRGKGFAGVCGRDQGRTGGVGRAAPEAKAKTSFQINRPQGMAKRVAGAGRLEIRLDRDFTTVERRKLEAAVRSLLNQIK